MGINIIREQILLKGIANKSSIKKFIPCGQKKATRIMEEIEQEALQEGKNIDFGFDSKRLLKYIHMTKNEIITNAEIERKRMK